VVPLLRCRSLYAAQQRDELRRIGVLVQVAQDDPEAQASVAAFQTAMQELGWSNGHNLQIDVPGAAGDAERMQTLDLFSHW
jgi:putative ABC transport system substrate-binding protein